MQNYHPWPAGGSYLSARGGSLEYIMEENMFHAKKARLTMDGKTVPLTTVDELRLSLDDLPEIDLPPGHIEPVEFSGTFVPGDAVSFREFCNLFMAQALTAVHGRRLPLHQRWRLRKLPILPSGSLMLTVDSPGGMVSGCVELRKRLTGNQ